MAKKSLAVLMICLLFTAACVTVGWNFSADRIKEIEVGKTTKVELLGMFGQPYQKGLEDGQETWTYVWIQYGPKKVISKELHIKFKDQGKVSTYSFSTSEPGDLR